jgi:hypothetical protein
MIRVFHFMCVPVRASVFTLTQTYGHRQIASEWMYLKIIRLRIKNEDGVPPSPSGCYRIKNPGVYFLQKQGESPSRVDPLQLPILKDLSVHPVLKAIFSRVDKQGNGLKVICPKTHMVSLPLASIYLHNTALTQNCNQNPTILYSTNFQICGSEE